MAMSKWSFINNILSTNSDEEATLKSSRGLKSSEANAYEFLDNLKEMCFACSTCIVMNVTTSNTQPYASVSSVMKRLT